MINGKKIFRRAGDIALFLAGGCILPQWMAWSIASSFPAGFPTAALSRGYTGAYIFAVLLAAWAFPRLAPLADGRRRAFLRAGIFAWGFVGGCGLVTLLEV